MERKPTKDRNYARNWAADLSTAGLHHRHSWNANLTSHHPPVVMVGPAQFNSTLLQKQQQPKPTSVPLSYHPAAKQGQNTTTPFCQEKYFCHLQFNTVILCCFYYYLLRIAPQFWKSVSVDISNILNIVWTALSMGIVCLIWIKFLCFGFHQNQHSINCWN